MVQLKITKFVWMDGKFVRWENAKVHALTHALHYGSAVFEGIRSYEAGKKVAVFRLDDHIERLFHSAKELGMQIKFTKNELKGAVKKLIKANELKNAYIRPLAYYGFGDIGVYPKNVQSNLLIIALPDYDKPAKHLRVMISKYLRPSEKSTVFGAKISGSYANSILAMKEARDNGFDEALMLDGEGFVSEGPTENLFLVKNKELITPNSTSALHGITRDTILKISKDLGIKTYEKKVTINEVINSEELFFCGTGKEISPIISVDNGKIGNGKIGKITSAIKSKYFEVVRGKDTKYNNWLDYVD